MPSSNKDKALPKNLYQFIKYGSRRIVTEFSEIIININNNLDEPFDPSICNMTKEDTCMDALMHNFTSAASLTVKEVEGLLLFTQIIGTSSSRTSSIERSS